ncbi:MAG: GNAT family N-acetyltransferase [Acholeplasmataceae bacterium]|nr:GNAT family N-acetyltransferase [Acholeplasmataceae bacterium]
MIKQIYKDSRKIHLDYRYQTSFFYDVQVKENGFELELKTFDQEVEKQFEADLFEPYIENPTVFVYEKEGCEVAFIEGSIQSWNHTYRIWNFLVLEDYQHQGIGKALMEKSIQHARSLSCRAVVLEVQSCNYPAINFYMKQGFKLIGLDTLTYSNFDIDKKEVHLEMGMIL